MDLFPWKVHEFEEKTEYYKSLVKQNVGSDEDDDDIDEGAASFHNQHTTSFMRSKSSFSDLNSKRQLFKEGDFETPKVQIYYVSVLLVIFWIPHVVDVKKNNNSLWAFTCKDLISIINSIVKFLLSY